MKANHARMNGIGHGGERKHIDGVTCIHNGYTGDAQNTMENYNEGDADV